MKHYEIIFKIPRWIFFPFAILYIIICNQNIEKDWNNGHLNEY